MTFQGRSCLFNKTGLWPCVYSHLFLSNVPLPTGYPAPCGGTGRRDALDTPHPSSEGETPYAQMFMARLTGCNEGGAWSLGWLILPGVGGCCPEEVTNKLSCKGQVGERASQAGGAARAKAQR